MIYFGIKFALSAGKISEFVGRPSQSDPTYIYEVGGWLISYTLGRNAFLDRAEAVKAAMVMRDKKVASLRKQIAKLEAMDFES